MTTKIVESYFIKQLFVLFLLAPFGTSSQKDQKSFFWLFYPLKKIKNSKIQARHTNSMLIQVQKDILVQEILLLEVWVIWGEGGVVRV